MAIARCDFTITFTRAIEFKAGPLYLKSLELSIECRGLTGAKIFGISDHFGLVVVVISIYSTGLYQITHHFSIKLKGKRDMNFLVRIGTRKELSMPHYSKHSSLKLEKFRSGRGYLPYR
jgi:hypothetical protein